MNLTNINQNPYNKSPESHFNPSLHFPALTNDTKAPQSASTDMVTCQCPFGTLSAKSGSGFKSGSGQEMRCGFAGEAAPEKPPEALKQRDDEERESGERFKGQVFGKKPERDFCPVVVVQG